jgi:hypothetical protein
MAMRVNVVCRNYKEDRVLPRFARYLGERLGWTVTTAPLCEGRGRMRGAPTDVIYLMGYFEAQLFGQWPTGTPVAVYFTHREEEPPGNDKSKLFDAIAVHAQLRVAMCRLYGEWLGAFGPTIIPPLPLERDRFVIAGKGAGAEYSGTAPLRRRPVVGFSGYTYRNHRKGDDLVNGVVKSQVGQKVAWVASGRGWPVETKRYAWADMPKFYQGLDVLVCPSRVEGGPMPVLEALACGVRAVIPQHVGILDELPDAPGVHRYVRGNAASLIAALEAALDQPFDREALRATTERYSVQAFCDAHAHAFEQAFADVPALDAGIAAQETPEAIEVLVMTKPPQEHHTGSTRGIYIVAFGDPARHCAVRLMKSVKTHLPDIPIALCAAKKIGLEDVFIPQPDSDVGGRRAKLKAYELTPAEWKAVLYLDADTKLVAPVYQFFQWIEDGWEFVICKDPHLMDTMHAFKRHNNEEELAEIKTAVHTLHTLQINGGVWAFGRNPRVAAFFARWQTEWEKHAQRDQGALLRALYADPLKVFWMGNEWNTFDKYCHGIETAGIMHYVGDARRWKGAIQGRIDSAEAWAAVRRWERERG